MRQFLSVLVLSVFVSIGTAYAQTLTTSQPLNKNVVLEEYTGIHCQYCPEGHAISAAILANNPGRASVIAIHQGPYAVPSSGEPDYRTPFGDALAGQTGLTGYPAGTVNRHVFTGTTTGLGRGDWTADAGIILQQPSPVNLGVETSYNSGTRELTVHVELYYTGNSNTSTNYINVALIQNHIFGPQTGGGAGNNYEHMEMLRYLITGQWGDAVATTTSGSLVERTYNYTIPTAYNSIPCVVENCEVVAFVAESHQEILTGDVVAAINGTNLYIGDITTTGTLMKLGQPSTVTNFDLDANSNLDGTQLFKLKLVSSAPTGWSANFEVDGMTFSDSTMVELTNGTPTPVILHVTPGDTAGFGEFRFALSSFNNPNAPVKYFTTRVLSNVHTLLVNAAGDNNATAHQGVYIDGLVAAGCDHLAVMKSDLFVQAKDAGILPEILNVFYNCAWTFPAFTDPEAIALKAMVGNGVNLLVAGQDIGWDIMSLQSGYHGTPVTTDFYTNYLKAHYVADGSTANNKLIANTNDLIYGTVQQSNVVDVYGGNMYPDEITPLQNATETFYYNTAKTKIGAIRSTFNQAKVSYFGVGLEMVQSVPVRNDIISRTYNWFMEGLGINDNAGNRRAFLGQNYPNPAKDGTVFPLNHVDHDMMIQITDLMGRIIVSEVVRTGAVQISVPTSSLTNGIYLCRLVSGDRVIDARKMSIQH